MADVVVLRAAAFARLERRLARLTLHAVGGARRRDGMARGDAAAASQAARGMATNCRAIGVTRSTESQRCEP